MPATRLPTAPFTGGISKQPASNRQLHEVEDAINASFSIADGMQKRMGTRHILQFDRGLKISNGDWIASTKTLRSIGGFINYQWSSGDVIHIRAGLGVKWGSYLITSKINNDSITLNDSISNVDLNNHDIQTGLAIGMDYGLHAIDRDQDERYLILYGPNTIRCIGINGVENIVTITDSVREYLSLQASGGTAGCEAANMRLATNVDYTIIGSTNVPMRTTVTNRYTVTQTFDTYEDMIAANGIEGKYYRTKIPASGHPAGYYRFNIGAATPAVWMGDIVGGYWAVADNWDDPAINPGRFGITVRKPDQFTITNGTWNEASKTFTSSGAFVDYTWSSGDQIYIASGTDTIPGIYDIASKTDDNNIVLATSLSSSGDLATGDISTGVYDLVSVGEINVPEGTFNGASMHDVADQIAISLQAANPNILISWQPSTSLTGRFVITGPYVGSGAIIIGPYNLDVQISGVDPSYRLAESPVLSRKGKWFTSAGTGDPKTKIVDVPDRWTRVAAPGQPDGKIDATTMPVKLIRLSVPITDDLGVFHTGSWLMETINWDDRFSGDKFSNPPPSIFKEDRNNQIADITFHRNRFTIASDESIVCSQYGDLFNFWINDATNHVDSDPVDLVLSTSRITLADFLEEFRSGLLVQTKTNCQFEITGDKIFSQATANATATTKNSTIQDVQPAAMGSEAYLASNINNSGTIYEYTFDDQLVKSYATEITAHVRGLIPADIKKIVCSSNTRTLVVLPKKGDRLYIYQTHFQDNLRVQQAWSVYEMGDADRIISIESIQDKLYILMESQDARFHLVSLELNDNFPQASHGLLFGDPITNLDYTDFQAITNGSFSIRIDGVLYDIFGCDFSSVSNNQNLAEIIQERIVFVTGIGPTVRIHQGKQFVISSGTIGPESSVSDLGPHTNTTGIDISTMIGAPGISYSSIPDFEPKIDMGQSIIGIYQPSTGITVWDYDFDDPMINTVILGVDFGSMRGQAIPITHTTDSSIWCEGDYSGGSVLIGRTFTMESTLSQQYARDQNNTSIIEATVQLIDVSISYKETGDFAVVIQREGYEEESWSLRASLPANQIIDQSPIIQEGVFIVPINAQSDEVKIIIRNNTVLPSKIVSADFRANVEQKIRS